MPALRLPGATYAVPVPLDSTDVPSRLISGDENSSRASILAQRLQVAVRAPARAQGWLAHSPTCERGRISARAYAAQVWPKPARRARRKSPHWHHNSKQLFLSRTR